MMEIWWLVEYFLWACMLAVIVYVFYWPHVEVFIENGSRKIIWHRHVRVVCAGKQISCGSIKILDEALNVHPDFRKTDIFTPKHIFHFSDMPDKSTLVPPLIFKFLWKRVFIIGEDRNPNVKFWRFLAKNTKTYRAKLVKNGRGQKPFFQLERLSSVTELGEPVFTN